jgi:hypothetical protein
MKSLAANLPHVLRKCVSASIPRKKLIDCEHEILVEEYVRTAS